MKLIATAAVAAIGLATVASADVSVTTVDFGWGSGDTGEVIAETISLPAAASIDSITVDISHTWGNDLLITLTAPNGDVFDLMSGEAGSVSGGNFDMGLVAGDGSLGNVAPYMFVESGGSDEWDDALGGGTYNANAWGAGGYDAGDWAFSVSDLFGGDPGAIGDVTIMYTVPAPGALALLGLAGFAGRRRRNG